MDRMELWELEPILSGLPLTDRNSWEQTRLRIYTLASMFSKQEHSLQDFLSFPWEDIKNEQVTGMSNIDKERLKAKADEIAKILK